MFTLTSLEGDDYAALVETNEFAAYPLSLSGIEVTEIETIEVF